MTSSRTTEHPASADVQLKVEIKQVNFHNEDSGWAVLTVRDVWGDGTHVTVVGDLPGAKEGQYFILCGRWIQHKTFGRQFRFNRAISARPDSREGMIRYLSSGLFKGVGKVTADRIVGHFGQKTFDVMSQEPERLHEVPKLAKKLADRIAAEWHAQELFHDTRMFLYQHGLTGVTARKLMEKYGDSLVSRLSRNPYFLIAEVRGIGFRKADQIALSVGMDPRHSDRVKACILFLLGQAEDQGHCFQTTEQLLERLQFQLQLPDFNLQELQAHLPPLHDRLLLASVSPPPEAPQELSHGQQWHFLDQLYQYERDIADKIQRMLVFKDDKDISLEPGFRERVQRWTEQFCQKTGCKLSSQQREAVFLAASHKVFILTGGPGVGKTTTANAIIALFRSMGKSLSLAAPTGRAAQRLAEVSGYEAKTIHRLLEWSAQDRTFKKDEDHPLTTQVVMIDESSMLDVRLARNLVCAVPENSRLILMGDVDQLPPVGPGNVLRDLIQSRKVSCLKLTQVFRQAAHSKIISAAHRMNHGEYPEFTDDISSDCRFIVAKDPENILELIRDLLLEHLPKAGYNPLMDVQILTPMNRGDLGCHNLNHHIQLWLNPECRKAAASRNRDQEHRKEFFRQDKVIQGVNNYELSVFNGDIGFITDLRVGGCELRVQMGERDLAYDQDQVSDLSLAYAITIHKSQGSEFPVVIIPMTMSHYVMLQRNLIYTALTRARKLAIFVGDPKALALGIGNTISLSRQTWLGFELDKLWKERLSYENR